MKSSHPYSPQKAAYQKKWARRNPEKRAAYRKKYDPEYHKTPTGGYSLFKARAKARKLPVDISFEQYTELIPQKCYYCGLARGQGLDRIDNALGYVNGNIRPCCMTCNRAKSDMTEEQFKNWVTAIAKHWI